MPDEPAPARTDPMVDRVNELVTTFLDTAAVVALAVAAFLWAQTWGNALGVAVAGVVLMLFSGLAQARHRSTRKLKAPAAVPHRAVVPPGPEDPGNLHVKGR